MKKWKKKKKKNRQIYMARLFSLIIALFVLCLTTKLHFCSYILVHFLYTKVSAHLHT